MAVILSVVNAGSVVGAQQLGSASNGVPRIKAVAGARYVLSDSLGGNVATDVVVKRVGKNLLISQEAEGVEQGALVIEDFYGSDGQLVSEAADGQYHSYAVATESGATDAAALSDGATMLLTLMPVQPATVAGGFQFAEGGSSALGGALASMAAVAGGIALNNGSGGGGKAQLAPGARSVALEVEAAAEVAVETGATVEAGTGTTVEAGGVGAAVGEPIPAVVETVLADAIEVPESSAPVEENDAEIELVSETTDTKNKVRPNTILSDAAAKAGGAIGALSVEDIPAIEKVLDDHGVIQGFIENGGYTDDVYPTLMGHADPGVKVHVYRGKYLQGFTVADENGEWSYTPSSAYASGTHSMTVKYEYPNKDTSGYSEPYIITIDKIAPKIPLVTGILDDEGRITGSVTEQTITDDNRPTITGTAEANTKLIVYDKGREIGSTTVGADGTWSFTPETPLADGLHILSYSVVDRAGNSSEQTAATEFIVDTRPEKITIYYADDDVGSVTGAFFGGSTTDDSTPTLRGAATAGGIVKIYEGDVLLGQVKADVDGSWEFTPATPLSEGAHTLHATVTLVAKGESERSKPFVLTVDSQPLDKPTIVSVADDVGAITTNVSEGGTTDDTKPEFKGKAQALSTVIILDNGVEIGRVQADASGNWSFTPANGLSDGVHSITVSAINLAGNVSAPSDAFGFTVDTVPPAKPAISALVDDAGAVTGDVLAGGVTDDTKPEFKGKAEAGSTIIIKDGSEEIGRAQADVDGNWTFTPENELSDGAHSITVTAVDLAGNVSAPSDAFGFTVDTLPPAKPTIVAVIDDVGGITGGIAQGGFTDDVKPGLHGTAEANSTVVIKDGNNEIGRVQADASGNWSFTPGNALAEGVHSLTVTAIDLAGNASVASEPFDFTVDLIAPNRPTIVSVADGVGAITGNVTQGGVTDDTKPALSGEAEPLSTVIIYDNGLEIGRTQAGASGNWFYTPSIEFANSAHSIIVVSVDAAGNVSMQSDPFGFTVDTAPPAKPTIGSMADDAGAIIGNVTAGGVTDDTKPEFKGTAEAGSTIIIKDGNQELGRVQADVNGNWTFTPENELGNGAHSVTVTAVDAAGNASLPSDAFGFAVNTAAPGKPTIGTVTDDAGAVTGNVTAGGVTDDTKPEFKGTAAAGSTIIIKDGNTELGRVQADVDGNWTFTPGNDLGNGAHSITVTAVDAAGNASAPSDAFGFTVDTAPPAKPSIGIVVDDMGAIVGNVAAGGTTDDTKPEFKGKAEAGSTIIIKDGSEEIGRVQADVDGNWTFTPENDLSNGAHSITVTAVDAAGNASAPSDAFGFTVDNAPPVKPTISTVADDAGAITGNVTAGGVTDDTKPEFKGKAEANSTIIINDGSEEIGRVKADVNGNWTFTPENDLGNGAHSITVTAVDDAGNASVPSDAFGFTVDTAPPVKPTIGTVTDDAGAVTGNVTAGGVTDDTKPEFKGKAEANSTVIIKDGNTELGRVLADANGNWAFTPSKALAEGSHSITVTAVDLAGNVSVPSESFGFSVDTLPPAKPTILSVVDDVGTITGKVTKSGITDDAKPEFSGKAEANSTVIIKDGSAEIGRVQADATGNWSFTPVVALSDGAHSITVTAADKAGNLSVPSDVFGFTVDTVPPTQTATLTSISQDSGSNNADFLTSNGRGGSLLKGTLSAPLAAHETLQVSLDGGASWKAVWVDGTRWSTQDSANHYESWTVQTRVIDATGSVGVVKSQTITFDNVPPPAPTSASVSDGKGVSVSFDGASLNVGDKIMLIDGGKVIELVLTTLHLNSGGAYIAMENPPSSGLRISIVDRAGNVSAAINPTIIENFDHPKQLDIARLETCFGAVIREAGILSVGGSFNDPANNSIARLSIGDIAKQQPGNSNNDIIRFELNEAAKRVSFRISGVDGTLNYLVFYDKSGVALGRIDITKTVSYVDYSFEAAAGKSVSYFKLHNVNEGAGLAVDYMRVEPIATTDDGVIAVGMNGNFIGSTAKNVFVLDAGLNLDTFVGSIQGGGGTDTLQLTGKNATLDLGMLAGRINSVEVIDITGTGNNTLKLNVEDVLNCGSMSEFITTSVAVDLMIKGNAGDTVQLSDLLHNGQDVGNWRQGTGVSINGIAYDLYLHSDVGARLIVQSGVTVVMDNHAGSVGYAVPGAEVEQASLLFEPAAIELFASESTLLSPLSTAGMDADGSPHAVQDFGFDPLSTYQVHYAEY